MGEAWGVLGKRWGGRSRQASAADINRPAGEQIHPLHDGAGWKWSQDLLGLGYEGLFSVKTQLMLLPHMVIMKEPALLKE